MASYVRVQGQNENAGNVAGGAKKAGTGLGGANVTSRRPLQDFSNKISDHIRAGTTKPSAGGLKQADGTRPPTHQYATRQRTAGTKVEPNLSESSSAMSWSQVLERRAEEGRRSSVHSPPNPLPDIDARDRANPLAASDYVNDIFGYYKRVESSYMASATYMESQADINDRMRAILIDWLVEVHLKFKLMPETLHLTVNIIDRYLEKKQVSRRNLQLVGVTAMLIASKYEEIWAPEVRDFVYISDRAYTREQILNMEKTMLNELNFNLTVPTAYPFLGRYLKAAGASRETSFLAAYLVELGLVDCATLKYKPSMLACAAVSTAQAAMGGERFSYTLERHAGVTETEATPAIKHLAKLMSKAPTANLVAVHKKYMGQKFMEVAKTAVPEDILA